MPRVRTPGALVDHFVRASSAPRLSRLWLVLARVGPAHYNRLVLIRQISHLQKESPPQRSWNACPVQALDSTMAVGSRLLGVWWV